MRVLITGGAGFLGRWFTKFHVEHGNYVTVVDDLSAEGSEVPPEAERMTFHEMDCLEFFRHDDSRWDQAYHLAAPVGGRVKIEQDPLFNAHALALDEAFFRWAPGRTGICIYPSSSAVYGINFQGESEHQLLHEGLFHPNNPTWYAPDELYGFTKFAGEMLAWKSARYGVNTLCIRPFSGYGEGQSFDYPVPSIARRALQREDPLTVWGSGHQTRDFIHVDDIVRITAKRLEYRVKGYDSLNLGSGIGVSFDQVARVCAREVGYDPKIVSDDGKPQGVWHRRSDTSRQTLYTDKLDLIGLKAGLSRVLDDVARRLPREVASPA